MPRDLKYGSTARHGTARHGTIDCLSTQIFNNKLEHQMNPLLPPYVRNSTIFDSMDLSLQSARATTSPLNKGGVMGMPIAPQLDFGIKATTTTTTASTIEQQSLLTQQHQNYPIHNLSMNASSPQQQQEQVTNSSNMSKYLNANGVNDCSESSSMLPPMSTNVSTTTTTTPTTNANNNGNSKNNNNNNNNNSNPSSGGPSPVHYMRSDADLMPRLNEHFAKMNEMRRMSFDGEYPPKCVQKSEELVNKMMQATPQPSAPPAPPEFSPKKQSPIQGYQTPQQQQKTPPQLSPYHNQGGKRNGPNTPPNRSPTTPQQQQSLLLQGNGSGRQVAVGVMDFNQLHGNNNLKQSPIQQQQQQFIPPAQQQHNIYHTQQQQQQNSSPPNSQLLNRNSLANTDELKYNTTRSRSHSNSSSSSSSSDDDEDDDSVDSSNSSHSHHSRHKSIEKSNSNQATVDATRKDEVDSSKAHTPPPPPIISLVAQKPTSPQLTSTSPNNLNLDERKEDSLKSLNVVAAQENGLNNKESNENSNESILNKNCDFSQQMLDSPKTKKQKQALKIRNAEQTNSNSNSQSSLNNETKTEVMKTATTTMPTNDNAVLADDLRKEQTESTQMKAAYSPRSNSRSSHSSSSSSNCSHSSRSSNESKSHKTELHDLKPKNTNDVVNLNENSIKAETVMKQHKNETETVKKESTVKTETIQNVAEKSNTFEEVENKLEQMFAGIEDEEPQTDQTEQVQVLIGTPIVAELNLALQLANNSPTIVESDTKMAAINEDIKVSVPMATKASKKSTPPTPTQLLNTPASQFFNQSQDTNQLPPTKVADSTDTTTVTDLPSTSSSAQLKTVETKIPADIKEKKQTGKTTKRRGTKKSKSKNNTFALANNKTAANKNNGKQKQQQKSNRRRRHSSDEEDSNSVKDPTNSSSAPVPDVKYRSPFVLVKRDGSVTVINAPTAEEAGNEKLGGKNKKIPAAKYAHERNRIRGMHSSTLSNKYDADTTDSTWICVFCKRGPHKEGLGDLFGPYLISTDCDEYRTALKLPGVIDVDAMFAAKRRRVDMVQTHPRNLPIVPALHVKQQQHPQQPSPTTSSGGKGKKKRKSQLSESAVNDLQQQDTLNTSTSSVEIIEPTNDVNIFLGMGKVSENSYEVWIHEDCAVWAPDVYLVGSRVTGLDATVWNSTRYNCEICVKSGATVCCLERDCKKTAHAPCAKQAGWDLNEAQMKVYCRLHDERKSKELGVLSNALFFLNTVQTLNSYSFISTPP